MPSATAAARLAPGIIIATVLTALCNSAALAAKPTGGTATPVTVSIVAPASGATVTSTVVTSGSASTSAHRATIASVQVSVDSGPYQTASGSTSWSYTVSSLTVGGHTITVVATDTKGNTASASISVTVSTVTSSATTVTPPTSTIVWPRYANAVVAGTYTLEGASSDNTYGVAKEQWAVDGTVVATGTSAYGLSYNWDTTTVAQGSHTVTYTTWDTAGTSSSASQPITVGTATIKRVAVILYDFDNQTPPTTPQQVFDWTFGTTRSVAGYYQEDSYGKLLLGGQYNASGDVFGFYTIPYAEPTTATCDFTDWEAAAIQQATAAGIDFQGYDVYMLTAAVPAGCGTGYGGGVQDRVPWNGFTAVDQWIASAGHELGHSFGIHHHADSWTCVDSSGHPIQVDGTCTSTEYGDPYDMMASGKVEQMNAYEKGQLGFFGPGNAITVTAAGTYSLAPLTAPSSGVQSIRIPRAWDSSGTPIDFYYLEYRQPSPYDVVPPNVDDYNGVLIREAPDYSQAATVSNLIDATPGSLTSASVHDNFDAPLVPGEYFQDFAIGLSVATLSVTSSGASVSIAFGPPPCVRVNPSVQVSPPSQSGVPGQTLYYTVIVANNDSPACGPSDFTETSSLPAGFAQAPADTSITAQYPAGSASSWLVAVTLPSGVASGVYALGETAINSASGESAAALVDVNTG